MTVTPLPFRETTFFRDVRDRMQAGHGMFAGSGRDLPSVSAAPAFDRIGVPAWPASQTLFVATAADPKIQTIASGQFCPNCHHISPSGCGGRATSPCRPGP
jgi:hypothetical protein